MKRIIGIALSMLGVLGALFALVYGAVRDTESAVEVKVPAGDSTFVATAPGVLALYSGAAVTITADAPADGEILWGIGRSADVQAYLGESAYTRLDGLKSLTEPKISTVTAKPEVQTKDAEALKSGSLALEKSDLWEESGRTDDKLQLEYKVPQGTQRAFIAATTTGAAPDFTIHWSVEAKSFPAVQIAVFGILIALVGIYLLFADNQSRARKNYFRNREAQHKSQQTAQASAQTQILPVFKGNLAAVETDRETQRVHTDSAFGAGILPGTSRTHALRLRPLTESERIELPDFARESAAQQAEQEAAAAEVAKQAAQTHAEQVKVTEGALGAAILAGSADADEFRSRPLADADRIVIPVDHPEQPALAEPDVHSETNLDSLEIEPKYPDVDQIEEHPDADQGEETDWKKLWNFAIEETAEDSNPPASDPSDTVLARDESAAVDQEQTESETDSLMCEKGGEHHA